MNTRHAVLALALALSTAPAFAAEPTRHPCDELALQLVKKLDSGATELMDRLEKEGRISDNDLTEYDRIRKPAMDSINALTVTCKRIDREQRDTLISVFGNAVN